MEDLTREVVDSFAGAGDERFRELMTGLVRHLHAYAAEVGLTQEEWERAVAFLTETGQISSDVRQEFILLSDVLGLSMLTIGLNAPDREGVTESTVTGPFFVEGSPHVELGDDIAAGVSGRPCYLHGRVTCAGQAVAGARVEVWEADAEGFYDVQREPARMAGRAHLFTDEDGRFDFWSVQPAAYPIPHDGPVGRLLEAAGRSPMRPAHVHFLVAAEGCETLVTHVFVAGDPHLTDDAVFGVKQSLVVDFVEHPPGAGPRGRQLDGPWAEVEVELSLAAAG